MIPMGNGVCGKWAVCRKGRQFDEKYDFHEYQQPATHLTYVYVSVTRIEFTKLKEDLQFLANTLKTVLTEYWDYF